MGTGSEVLRRIAAPTMVGGMLSSTMLTLLVIPALYALIKDGRLALGQVAATELKVSATPRAAE